ncbi:MAG: NADH-quinone oxidoreductase subunit NuoG, partial [Thermoleophilaceae bacterium]|nr:NADH-quinone oxidoreductase subunit NuoG [Thermoleophilaceae bacterium]
MSVNNESSTGVEAPQPKANAQFTLVDALPPGYAAKPAGEPDRKTITFTIDGAQVNAPEGIMLVDAAKYGGVEIPVFCYEPKIGGPVGACRMCLVEIEGIPKLQTACSTPVRDGMSVITRSPRVAEAQNSVVEFLLANHPLDCPVCDKGGECPLQDIAYGWGRGKSRFTEPKRHFEKPVALSPSIAIDRERCILCYRCVRFSQEVSEDHQLVLLERGSQSYVGTFDGNPYIAPFSGNVIELCPVGALTSQAYRFKARPWDVEQGGSVCTLCPAQCNVSHTVRDEQVMRTLARDNNGVDDGWICDKGRFAHQAWQSDQRITQPLVRQGDKLLPARWDHALEVAAAALKKSGAKTVALAGGGSSNEEGWLLRRLMLEAVGSPHIDSRRANKPTVEIAQTLFAPSLTAAVPDLEWADAVLVLDCELVDDMPIIDLRIRKGVRRNGVKLAIASARPSTLDGVATASARYAPGQAGAFTQALLAALGAPAGGELEDLATRAGSSVENIQAVAATLTDAQRVVIVWSERLSETPHGGAPLQALCNLAGHLNLSTTDGAGLFQVPIQANGRGLREIGVLPHLGPGFAPVEPSGMSSQEMATSDQLGA